MKTKLYKEIASRLKAIDNCVKTKNTEWRDNHTQWIEELVKNYMPSGSGIDCGTKINIAKSNSEKLVFYFEYHHMNDVGMYDGWTDHTLIVKPSLCFDIDIKISGKNRDDIKDYLYEIYDYALRQEIDTEEFYKMIEDR